jgi:hypothetical protein
MKRLMPGDADWVRGIVSLTKMIVLFCILDFKEQFSWLRK